MTSAPGPAQGPFPLAVSGDDEMSRRIRAFPWAETPLGPMAAWPQSLRTALSILLGSGFPMQLLWGQELIHFYNEAYIPIAAGKHPAALGQPAAAIWPEVWDLVGPMLQQVLASGRATRSDDLLLVLNRRGALEEGYFTFSYGPVRGDDGAVVGIFIAVTETTGRVIAERRLRILRDLSAAVSGAEDEAAIGRALAEIFAGGTADLPFAVAYLLDQDGQTLRRVGAVGLGEDHPAAPRQCECVGGAGPWPMGEALRRRSAVVVAVDESLGPLPGGPWAEAPRQALVLPLAVAGGPPVGCLIAGLSPHLRLDPDYQEFLERLAGQIGIAVAAARAQAEARADIRARDDFLSVAAHELKTPLTPVIGQLQILRRRLEAGGAGERDLRSIRTAVEQAGRLSQLIDDLLDVSRLRNGQLAIVRRPLDLSELADTVAAELLPTLTRHTLSVELPGGPVLVSGDQIRLAQVLRNPVSNAVKYSPEGGPVRVRVEAAGGAGRLVVSDEGLGMAAAALPRLFERYYRAVGDHDSIGGLGVGLYVVREIVDLHDGHVSVVSEPGIGSSFTVSLPLASGEA